MPTYAAWPFAPPRLRLCLRDIYSITARSKYTCRRSPNARFASAATLDPKSRPPTNSAISSHGPRTPQTTIHYTSAFLRRVLPRKTQHDVGETESLEFWDEMLGKAQDELNAPRTAARIAVYGVDEHSGARQLVNALLEDAFAPDAYKLPVRERWKSATGPSGLLLRYGAASRDIETSVSIRSSWLQQFPVPVEIHELPPQVGSPDMPPHVAPLFSADIPIMVCNPLTTPLSKLFANSTIPWTHTNAILVVTAPSTAPIPPILMEHVQRSVPESLTVLFVDPVRALSALDILSSDPTTACSIQRYQDGFSESRISDISIVISKKLAVLDGITTGSTLTALRTQNALNLVSDALNACYKAIRSAEMEADRVRMGTSSLQGQMEEFRVKISSDVLGAEDETSVKDALEEAKLYVKESMDRLTGWRMLWKIDDIADTVSASIDKSWCRDLENKLIFQTGRLSVTQNFLAGAANALLTSFPQTSTFHSPVLQNVIAQLRTQPLHAVNPALLTEPIRTRRTQLIHPTSTLHASAQHAVMGMSGSVIGGLGVAWTGWAGQFGFLGTLGLGLEAETAASLGMFSAVAGVWYFMGRWEKAKNRWWRDWDRVGEGLKRDLQTSLHTVVTDQVLAVPTAACKGLQEMIAKREDEIALLRDEMLTLEEDCVHW